MANENSVKTKIDIATLGLKLDNIDLKISEFINNQNKINSKTDGRLDIIEKEHERWKGYWLGGLAIITAIFSVISLLIKFL